jgi:hypothetical protein
MKAFIIMALLISSVYSISWSSFVSLSLEEKMLLQNEGLKRIENGTVSSPYLTSPEASSIRKDFTSTLSSFASYYPSEYNRAVSNVKGYMQTISTHTVVSDFANETKFIKVGDIYVSEAVCKASPKLCEVAPEPVVVKNKTVVANKRTAAECVAARQKDWDARVYSNYPNIPTEGVNEVEKQALLDRIAEGYYSWQAICLRGE